MADGQADSSRTSAPGRTAPEPVVLAVDIGSSGVRCLAHTEDHRVLAVSARDLATTSRPDGQSTHSWAAVLDATTECLRELAVLASIEVAAISLSGTASSLAVARASPGGGSQDVGDVLLWSDSRASAFAEDPASAGAVARFGRTLCPAHPSYWPAKVRWALAAEAPGRRASLRLAGAKDFVFEVLTGQWWVDPMTAAATGVFDSRAWGWDTEFLAEVGLEPDQLPEVHEGTDSAPATPAVVAALGLPARTPVVLGGMDGPLAQLGAAGFRTDAHTCTVGTSLAYRAGVASRREDPARRVWCYPVSRDFWVLGGAGSNGGNVLTWLAATLGRGSDVGGVVEEALGLAPEAGLLFLPYLHGERAPLWRDDLRAAVIGLAAHHTAADIARAALDGVGAAAIELAGAVTAVAGAAQEVRLTGGFLKRGEWAQLVTDALGVPTCVPDPEAATATGAAVLGWMALGRPRPRPPGPGPAQATQRREPDAAVHAVLRSKAEAVRQVRAVLAPERGPGTS